MVDTLCMTVEENVAFAKGNFVEILYHSARLEGFMVTLRETYAVVENAPSENIEISAVTTILNLKHAW